MNRRIKVLGAIAASMTLAAGAGGAVALSQGDAEAPSHQPLCDLVTTAEAQAAIGQAAVATDYGTACAYTPTAGGRLTALTISLGPDGITPETFADGMSAYSDAAGAPLRQVTDVGDESWVTTSDVASQIIARQGERFIAIVLVNSGATADEQVQTLAGLARAALSRIG